VLYLSTPQAQKVSLHASVPRQQTRHERPLDLVLVHEAEAAHSTSSVLNETNLMAVGQHSIGASP
jgi:hypothetical protein